jgi:serine/threonine protein kinase
MTDGRPGFAERSDSGPLGRGYRESLGLGDSGLLQDQITEATMREIEAVGLTDLQPVDRGGYGVVLRAKDRKTNNRRAVKVVLDPEGSDSCGERLSDRLQIFRREYRILSSPELPAGIAPQSYSSHEPPGSQAFLVQEWIEGQKLSDWLKANPTLTMSQRERVCRAIFATYARLHARNLMHRDVSLGNIMITARTVRLIDFGGAGRAAAGYPSLNTPSRVPVTPGFCSGPVWRGERKASLADEVHAVAKVCFTVLTGAMAASFPTTGERRAEMKRAGCGRDLMGLLLPRMEDPPQELALQSMVQEI